MKSKTMADHIPSSSMQNTNIFESRTQSTTSSNRRLYEINTSFRPIFSNFVTVEDRLKSFETAKWPSHFKSQPDTLSKVGFFYLGPATKAVCFQCGGVIMWEEADDAFVEHKHFFPKCFFVIKLELFQQVVKKKNQLRVAEIQPRLRTANLNMSLESDRLKTFDDDWHYTYIDKKELAIAGFYYTGNGDNKVVCYICKVAVCYWERGAEHLKHSPNCPLTPLCKEIFQKKSGCLKMSLELDRLKTFDDWHYPYIDKKELAQAGFYYTGNGDEVVCYVCKVGVGVWERGDDPAAEHLKHSPYCPLAPLCKEILDKKSPGLNKSCLNMSLELDRLKTFDDWHYTYIDKKELAQAGFYYIGTGDKVVCYVCKVGVCDWEQGDDPAAEHLKYSPNCPLAPFCKEILEKESRGGYDTCGLYDDSNRQPSKYPKYERVECRISSFKNWNKLFRIRCSVLWEAGFFYTGINDHCVCYKCGLGLKNWREQSDPWIEHAVWYPKCDYLLSIKGTAFVNDACRNKRYTMILSKKDIKNAVAMLQNMLIRTRIANVPQPTIEDKHLENNQNDGRDKLLCKICYTNKYNKVLYPCGHVSCSTCAENLTTCGFCRNHILKRIQIYVD